MLSHKIGSFYNTGDIIIMDNYSQEENVAYLSQIMDVSFNFKGEVKSIGFALQVPHKNRLANIFLFNRPASEIIEENRQGKKTDPLGIFTVKLSQDGRKDIWSAV